MIGQISDHFKKTDLTKISDTHKELSVLLFYWVATTLACIIIEYFSDHFGLVSWLESLTVVFVSCWLLWWVGTSFSSNWVREILIVFSALVCFSALYGIYWIVGSSETFNIFSMLWASFIVIVFEFILYYENYKELKGKSQEYLKLSHQRYMEYMRSTFWAILFVMVALIAGGAQILKPEQSKWTPAGFDLLYVSFTFGFGFCLMAWVYHRKLCQIAKLII